MNVVEFILTLARQVRIGSAYTGVAGRQIITARPEQRPPVDFWVGSSVAYMGTRNGFELHQHWDKDGVPPEIGAVVLFGHTGQDNVVTVMRMEVTQVYQGEQKTPNRTWWICVRRESHRDYRL